ncbi:Aminomethyltransferase [Corynebacterium ciconiae DSM 44920]|uniref:glycine cleavage system aminomethyltransferase GcvT n=1 Tax=Corynebacterium ciconiae TaxID=227319 RepID=UPI0003712A88|nr:glycine cleavage system aminomethyltransferase GcvT [Corynebacterium ciconiae]WKD60741.1 Aminomethyltransferase [Corynebacterium ciconiae DSM 44920]
MTDLLQSPLHDLNEKLGASFTDFGGWNMPLKYGRELEEHRAVRERVGVFDLSHMGELSVRGRDAAAFLDYVLISQLSTLPVGKAKYSMIVNADGGIIDDLITYRVADDEFLVVPNAGNQPAVWAAFSERARERFPEADVHLENQSLDTALIAVQGPSSVELLAELVPAESQETLSGLSYYSAAPLAVAGVDTLVARTGYTGEDGFEVYVSKEQAPEVFRAIVDKLEAYEGAVCGLAARDSLRLEAAMPLYGHELNQDLTPVDAGLRVLVGKNKTGEFYGDQLRELATPQRKLVGLRGEGRRAARAGSALYVGDELVGEITSGQLSPTLGYPIALAYVAAEYADEGTTIDADVRGKRQPMTICPRPFYKRG